MSVVVSVIIIDFNSGDKLWKCLSRLKAQSYEAFEIIIVNNGSQNYDEKDFSELDLDIRILFSNENLGFAKANNKAITIANGDWLAFLNPDAYPEPEWLAHLMSATKVYTNVKAFGSTQIMASNPNRLDGAGDAYHILGIPYRGYFNWPIEYLPEDGEVFAVCAAAALYEKEVFKNLGGFDERFFCYGEDLDLGFRHRLCGGSARQVTEAIVHHEGSGLSGRHSDFTIYHGHRNRIWLAYKNTPFWLYWPFLPLHIFANLYLLIRSPFSGITKSYLKGIWHGYRDLGQFSKSRRDILKKRNVDSLSIAKSMTWSPFKLSRRQGTRI